MDLAYWHDISHPVLLHFRGNARISEAAWVIDLAESRVEGWYINSGHLQDECQGDGSEEG
jgi:hypothetical protein